MMEGKCANQIYDGHKFFLLPARLGNTRLSILKGNIIKQGGILLTSLEDSDNVLTHVVVEESFLSNPDKCYKIFKDMGVNCSHLEIVTTKWLSSCFKEQKLLETKPFLLGLCNTSTHLIQPSGKQDNAAKIQSAPIYQEPGDLTLSHASSPKKRKHDDEVVETVQIPDTSVVFNSVIISELNKLAETFRSIGDQWRAHGYEKAVAAVKGYGKNINTYEEAVALPGIGKKMAEKIMEIIETGSLRKVDEVCNSEKSRIMKLFTKIWGVGPATAQSWYVQGFRTLEDLESKANLTKQQRIGLKYFEEFQEKIPREEVQQVGDIVIENALVINNNVTPVLCGSYRRGKSSCGDIDVLLLTEGSLSELLAALLKRLKLCVSAS